MTQSIDTITDQLSSLCAHKLDPTAMRKLVNNSTEISFFDDIIALKGYTSPDKEEGHTVTMDFYCGDVILRARHAANRLGNEEQTIVKTAQSLIHLMKNPRYGSIRREGIYTLRYTGQ